MTPAQWDIVVVPFPFTDGPGNKRRPAVVISPGDFNQEAGHSVLIMITSASRSTWPGDFVLDHGRLGLHKPCVLRMKFFTLDNRLIERVITTLPTDARLHVRLFLARFCNATIHG